MEQKLRHEGGPKQGRTAILVMRIDDVPDEPGQGLTNVYCLPDMEPAHLIQGLEKFVADLKAGSVAQSPTIEGEVIDDVTKTVQ